MPHCITIESNGGGFTIDEREDTLLRGALRAGFGLPYECSVGGCGACRFELLEGSVETLWDGAPGLSERDRKCGKRLACQSRPLGDCTVRLRPDDAYRPLRRPTRVMVRLASRRDLTGDMVEFGFQADGPADFLPGQYALLYLPGVTGPRAYSMSNLANATGLWQFIVRRAGRGSSVLRPSTFGL